MADNCETTAAVQATLPAAAIGSEMSDAIVDGKAAIVAQYDMEISPAQSGESEHKGCILEPAVIATSETMDSESGAAADYLPKSEAKDTADYSLKTGDSVPVVNLPNSDAKLPQGRSNTIEDDITSGNATTEAPLEISTSIEAERSTCDAKTDTELPVGISTSIESEISSGNATVDAESPLAISTTIEGEQSSCDAKTNAELPVGISTTTEAEISSGNITTDADVSMVKSTTTDVDAEVEQDNSTTKVNDSVSPDETFQEPVPPVVVTEEQLEQSTAASAVTELQNISEETSDAMVSKSVDATMAVDETLNESMVDNAEGHVSEISEVSSEMLHAKDNQTVDTTTVKSELIDENLEVEDVEMAETIAPLSEPKAELSDTIMEPQGQTNSKLDAEKATDAALDGVSTGEQEIGICTEEAEEGEERTVTMVDVLQEQQDLEDNAGAVLGASDDNNCTYTQGYIKRQALYACMTCCSDAKEDPTKRAGVCLACSLTCHENHELIELYTKRDFRCDCGNLNFSSHKCNFTKEKTELNVDNKYNQNFNGLYCICHRPYPDPESTVDEEMIQCIVCEDWLHASHLGTTVPANDLYSEMICKSCMDQNEFLHDYTCYAVIVEENMDVDVENGDKVESHISAPVEKQVAEKIDDNLGPIQPASGVGSSGELKNVTSENGQKESTNARTEESRQGGDSAETVNDDIVNKELINESPKDENNKEAIQDISEVIEKPDEISHLSDKNNIGETIENSNRDEPEPNQTIDGEVKVSDISTNSADSLDESSKIQKAEDSVEVLIEKDNALLTNDGLVLDKSGCSLVTLQNKDLEPNDSTDDKNALEETAQNSQAVGDGEDYSVPLQEKDLKFSDSTNDKNAEKETAPSSQTLVEKTDITDTVPIAKNSVNNAVEATAEEALDANVKSQVTSDNTVPSNIITTEIDANVVVNGDENDTVPSEDKSPKGADILKLNEIAEPTLMVDENTISSDVEMKDDSAKNNGQNLQPETEGTAGDCEANSSVITSEVIEDVGPTLNGDMQQHNKFEFELTNKRKLNTEVEDAAVQESIKKVKLNDNRCHRPKPAVRKVFKGATFWPCSWRQKLCSCHNCVSMYRDNAVLFLLDEEDTVSAYEELGKVKNKGKLSQYEKGLAALSSLDRIQQINALTEYNKMKNELLDFLISFKNRQEVVKVEDIEKFFADIKPKRKSDGVYFCR